MQQFLRFGVVGGIGFAIDATTLLVLVRIGVEPLVGRMASFIVAATVTFLLNHRFTFRSVGNPTVRSWSYYIVLTALGACVNLGVYHAWIEQFGIVPIQLVAGTALGSIMAMAINYTLSRMLVFDHTPDQRIIRTD